MDYTTHYSTRKTSQSQPIPGKNMVKNSASGFTFKISKWDELLRFLILGAEGGTYYASEQKLTADNATNVVACIGEDGPKVVRTLLDVSLNGRAPKQDPTLFVLALCCAMGNNETKKTAYDAINRICRTGTMLFNFVNNIQSLRGWSRGLRNGVSKYYTNKDLGKLELQLLKYRQRNGYTHTDVLRLAHPKTEESKRNDLLKYVVGKGDCKGFPLIEAMEEAKALDPSTNAGRKTMVKMITDTGLPREGVPTTFLKRPEVWEALLQKMPAGAMIRNLGKMTNVGITSSNLSASTIKIVTSLRNPDFIKKARVHPMNILLALKTYEQGHGFKGNLTWRPLPKIIDALNDAFYLSFGNVEPTNKRIMIGLDVSGSMQSHIANTVLSCREAAAAMAMVTMRTEEWHDIIGFTEGGISGSYMKSGNPRYGMWGYGVSRLKISPKQRLDDVVKYTSRLGFGGTDCALPMIYAEANKIPVDAFVIYTDNETWAGNIHPKQALDSYRQKMGIPAKSIVVGMTATGFSIADPSDAGMMDVVGFDTATPSIMSNFIGGWNQDN